MAGRNLLAGKTGRNLLAPAEPEGLLYKIPGVGGALKSFEQNYVEPYIGRAPNAQEGVQGLQDMTRVGVDAVSLGGADYLAGGNQAELTRQAKARLGNTAPVVEFGAGMLTPTGVPQKLGRGLQTVGHGVSGGTQSAIDAYTHGERNPWELAKAAGVGSGLSGAASAVTDPIASWWSRRKGRQKAIEGQTYKTEEDVRAAKKKKYEEVSKSGAVYQSSDVRQLAAELQNIPLSKGYDKNAIKLRKEIINDYMKGDLSPEELDNARKRIRKMSTGSERSVSTGEQMIAGIDKFGKDVSVYKPPTQPGGAYTLAPDINRTQLEARDLHGREKRHKLVRETAREAERATKAGRFNPFAPSPESSDVRKFSKVAGDIDKGNIRSKFTDPEIEKIKGIEEGTPLRNLGGRAEPYSFQGKFGGPMLGLAAAGGFVPGASQFVSAPILAGAAGSEVLSRLGQKATKREIEDLQALIRDPAGKGLQYTADPKAVAAAKEKLARIMGSGTRTGYRNAGEY